MRGGAAARRWHRVDLAPAGPELALSPYTAVIIGASVHYGRHPRRVQTWLRSQRALLEARPTAFFSVSLSADQRYTERFLDETDWAPELTAAFAGALRYSKYRPLKRLLVKAFAAIGGHDTDTSRDYDYTDWAAVERFASAFSDTLTSASSPGPRPSRRSPR